MISETSESRIDREFTGVCRSIGIIVMNSNYHINSIIYWLTASKYVLYPVGSYPNFTRFF